MLFVIIILLLLSIIFYIFYVLHLKRKNDKLWIDIFKNIKDIKKIGQNGGYYIFELKTIRHNFDILYHPSCVTPDLKILDKDSGRFIKISKNSWNIIPYLK